MQEKQQVLIKRVNALCKQKRLSYYMLSNKSGVPMSTLMHLLDGTVKNPGIHTIVRICAGMKITLAEFFDTLEFRELVDNAGDEG